MMVIRRTLYGLWRMLFLFHCIVPRLLMVLSLSPSQPSNIPTSPSLLNPSIAAPSPREFHWWTNDCNSYLDELDSNGGERFVASHDEKNYETHNWLHVTASTPGNRAQYEMRYVSDSLMMGGIVRFGQDCEGPDGHVHGGAIATIADAAAATVVYMSSGGRWGLTTKIECNYRAMLPLNCPAKVEAKISNLKKRRATVEWEISSLTDIDKMGAPVRYSFGVANFLLPRE